MNYYFIDENKDISKDSIGGKGFYLNEMNKLGLPVPNACFIGTEIWQEYKKDKNKTVAKLKNKIIPEIISNFKKHNNGLMPLISVRSAGAVSMPGMMDTILDVGVNQNFFKEYEKSIKKENNKKTLSTREQNFLADNYARFLSMYGQTVLGINKKYFEKANKFKNIAEVQVFFEDVYTKNKKKMPSQKIEQQILECVLSVFDSWDNKRAKSYRKIHKIDENAGTAVVLQQMVFGNKNNNSMTGVLFSRNPSNGKDRLVGEYLVGHQGEDVVSGTYTPDNMEDMREDFPDIYDKLHTISQKLEKEYHQVQDIEFTVEDNKVYILQARTAKCSPFAKLKMLMDMYSIKEVSAQDVLSGLSKKDFLELNVKRVDESYEKPADGTGLSASIGAMAGRVVFGPSTKYKDQPTILVAKETTPDDIEAVNLVNGVLTAKGGVTSHAAVVARGMGKICIVGCSDIKVSENKDSAIIGNKEIQSGDWITMDASTGKVWVGENAPIVDAKNTQIFWDLEDLVMEANPLWYRATSNIDELVLGKNSIYLTYQLDDMSENEMEAEFRDATKYLTGIMDLTGKTDFLMEKYEGQFLFADISAKQIFLKKKKVLCDIMLNDYDLKWDFQVYLGKYEDEYKTDFSNSGIKVISKNQLNFSNMENKKINKTKDKSANNSIIVRQEILDVGKDKKEKIAISSQNALLGVLK